MKKKVEAACAIPELIDRLDRLLVISHRCIARERLHKHEVALKCRIR